MAKSMKEEYDLNINTQKFILQMCWAQHDGQWFLKVKRKFGSKVANQLNQEVIFSMGKIEARHILNSLGIQKGTIQSVSEILKITNSIMEVIIPKVMKFQMFVDSEKVGRSYIKKCFIWEEVKKSKGEKEFECSCLIRNKGWTEAMGVNVEISTLSRFPDGGDHCEFKFILND